MATDARGQDAEVTDAAEPKPASLVPGEPDQPSHGGIDEMMQTEPLGDENVVLENETVGAQQTRGGGEFPDPDTPPSGPAPADGSPSRGKGTFDEVYREAGPEVSGSGS